MRRIIYYLLALCVMSSCETAPHRFRSIPSESSGIDFNNNIAESDSFNILTYEYIYNGGGVGIADFNQDGLADVYFTGNQVANALYLNEGKLRFRDITSEAGVSGEGRWSNGVAIADVNADGWDDIYICATAHPDSARRRNILYIHQGLVNGVPRFRDLAEAYGVDDPSHKTSAAFLDYDNDGDLDLFLALNKMSDGRTPNVYKNPATIAERVDRLFRNDWDSIAGHPVFTDVSAIAGIVHDGYSLGINTTDVNQDGWPDIYVTNDYLSNDLMYINQKDGTFKDRASAYFKHTSYSAMGNDVVDINNDGLPDIIALDMLPEDNYRRKTMLGQNNYSAYINNDKYGYQYQYVRNTLQLNQGTDPITHEPLFSDISFLAGVSSTDWSWTPLVADFDNDGLRDIIITNGFPNDVTDRDFVEYNAQAGNYASPAFLMNYIPSVKIRNYAYKNKNGLSFEDVTEQWGIVSPSFSNGAAFADLDNDGDLDYLVNNINENAFLFENRTNDGQEGIHHWLRLKLKGSKFNPHAVGAKVRVYTQGKLLYADQSPYRGFLSSVDPDLHFGLGTAASVDSVVIQWPGGRTSILQAIAADQLIIADIAQSALQNRVPAPAAPTLFADVSDKFSGYVHRDLDYIDFNIQPLLLHKLSQYGPAIAVADVNDDGLDDFYLGGSRTFKGNFFIQRNDGSFAEQDLFSETPAVKREEDMGVLFFDADDDGDQDLYVVSGGYEYPKGDSSYRHRFYENRGGRFYHRRNALPDFLQSGSCVRAADFDRDGDLDLFVGGRVVPHEYPFSAASYILRNESNKEGARFSMLDQAVVNGLVCDALWTDFNGDGWVDLMVAGEWMPVTFLENRKGTFINVTDSSGVASHVGWWNAIEPSDFDNDGDIDYIVSNLGLNTLQKASDAEPVSVYAADFDKNDKPDMMPTVYFKGKDGKKYEYPYFGRLDVQKELIKVKAKFLKHAAFGEASITDVLPPEMRTGALVYRANHFESSYLENNGKGRFTIRALQPEAQIAPVYGMLSFDIDDDGKTDALLTGNDFGTEVSMGRYDAFNGLVMRGTGDGEFQPLTIDRTGFCVKGDAKALVVVVTGTDKMLIVASQNKGSLRAFETRRNQRAVTVPPKACRMEVHRPGGKSIHELYYGKGFLSQSTRKVFVPSDVRKIVFTDFQGRQTIVEFTLIAVP